jgi:hypothetical protein
MSGEAAHRDFGLIGLLDKGLPTAVVSVGAQPGTPFSVPASETYLES